MIKLNDYKQMHWQDPSHRIAMLAYDDSCFVCDTGSNPFDYHRERCFLCRTCNTYLEFMNKAREIDEEMFDSEQEVFVSDRLDSNRDLALFKMKLLNNISITNKKGSTKNAFNLIAELLNDIPLHYKVLNVASLCLYTATTHSTLNRSVLLSVFRYAEHYKLISTEELYTYEERIVAL